MDSSALTSGKPSWDYKEKTAQSLSPLLIIADLIIMLAIEGLFYNKESSIDYFIRNLYRNRVATAAVVAMEVCIWAVRGLPAKRHGKVSNKMQKNEE
eukprot:scaffold34664_cov16-Prasinocladus_malaysianus.AAC.1